MRGESGEKAIWCALGFIPVDEHVESIFNETAATQAAFQQPASPFSRYPGRPGAA